jgi:branched-chain amino acid transport system ATP-binding protein
VITLAKRRGQRAGTLSGREQQMLAIAHGLMRRPRMLLMDEPSTGLAPLLVRQVAQTILDLNAQGVPVLLVEQMASMALAVADRAYVIQNGQVNSRARVGR